MGLFDTNPLDEIKDFFDENYEKINPINTIKKETQNIESSIENLLMLSVLGIISIILLLKY